ncbi:hypothetical protein V8F20_011013 [Naviculisporaceae sp. PSN 640]
MSLLELQSNTTNSITMDTQNSQLRKPTTTDIVIMILVAIVFMTFVAVIPVAAYHLANKASKRWPRQSKDGGFRIMGGFAILILSVLWPLSYPAIWIISSFVESDGSCFGFNYSQWQAKRRAKKAERAQDIELNAMERAQRAQEQRIREVNEESERYEAAKTRVAAKRDAMFGTGTPAGRRFQFDRDEELTSTGTRRGAGSELPSSSYGEFDIEAQEMPMPNTTASNARGGRGINRPSPGGEYIVVPRPIVVPPYLPRSINATDSQAGQGSPPAYRESANKSPELP